MGSTGISTVLADCYSFICFCSPHSRKEYQWRMKETNYIEQLKQLQETVTELVQQLNSLEDYHQHEKIGWQMEKVTFLEKLNELQNALHQKEVVTQQYKVYEDSFQKERQQIQDMVVTLRNLEMRNEAYQEEVRKLNEHIKSYRDVINVLSKHTSSPSSEGSSSDKIFTIEEEFVKASRPGQKVVTKG